MSINLQKLPELLDLIKNQYIDIAFNVLDKVSEEKEFITNHHLHNQMAEIKNRFIEKQDEYFSNILQPKKTPNHHTLLGHIKCTMHDLTLIDYEDFNFQLMCRKFSHKIYEALGNDIALTALRFEELLDHKLELDDLPIGPKNLAKSFQYAIKPIELTPDKKEILFKHLLIEFSKKYQHCINMANNTFIDKGILTDLNDSDGKAYFTRKKKKLNSAKKRNELMASINPDKTLDDQGDIAPTNMADLLQKINIPKNEKEHIFDTVAMAPDASQKQLLDAISELQNRLDQPLTDGYLTPKNEISLAKQLEKDTSLKDYNLTKYDANNISMMSMLFENIFDDIHIAPPIKALLEQLQAPLLKTAVLDENFFSDTHNPAQSLVDTIAEQGSSWVEDINPNKDFLYRKMADIVKKVNDDFDGSYRVFDHVLDDFDQFNKAHQARVKKLEKRIVSAEKAKARFERAKFTAQDHNAKVFSEYRLSEEMTEFFSQHWQLVLFYIHNKYDNQNNQEWRKAINTEKLLMLNLEGSTKANKKKTVTALQEMMLDTGQNRMDVNAGLRKIIPFIRPTSKVSQQQNKKSIQDPLLKEKQKASISVLHQTEKNISPQINSPIIQAKTSSNTSTSPSSASASENECYFDDRGEVEADNTSMPLSPDQLQQLHEQLTVGSWLAEDSGEITEKVKIAAYIKHTDTFILIRRNGTKFGNFSSRELSHRLTQRSLTLLESSMMFDRALESVIHSIRAA